MGGGLEGSSEGKQVVFLSHLSRHPLAHAKGKPMLFNLKFDKIPMGLSEKKVINPTLSMVRWILEETKHDRGNWILKNAWQTRKKGAEKFRAIRIEYVGGVAGVKIRCKPGSNDTCYEYILIPPAAIDCEGVYESLRSIHPNTLRLNHSFRVGSRMEPEERSILTAVYERATNSPPAPVLPRIGPKPVAAPEKPVTPKPEESEPVTQKSLEFANKDQVSENLQVSQHVLENQAQVLVAQTFDKICNLDITPLVDSPESGDAAIGSEQFILDRALVAISFVAENGFAKRTTISTSIVENLNIKGYIQKGKAYKSKEGAMRALWMALYNEGYVERIFHGKLSETLLGYKLTPKGVKRIKVLASFLDDSIVAKMNKNWDGSEPYEPSEMFQEEEDLEAYCEEEDETETFVAMAAATTEAEPAQPKQLTPEQILKLKGLISEFEHQSEQASEVSKMISELETEREDHAHTLAGVEIAKRDKMKQKEDLDRDIFRLDGKKKEIEEKINKNQGEMSDWRGELEAHNRRIAELNREVERLTGMSLGGGATKT